MTSRDFCYWLQGLFELGDTQSGLNEKQTDTIRKHLAMVFKHEIDPGMGDEKHQGELSGIHDEPKSGGSDIDRLQLRDVPNRRDWLIRC